MRALQSCDPGMMTYFTARSTEVAFVFECEKVGKCHSWQETCWDEQMVRRSMFMKKINPSGVVCQVYWYISQISGERLQDHWSFGFDHLTVDHALKMCMWFEYNPQINFWHLLCSLNFVVFWAFTLRKCTLFGYTVPVKNQQHIPLFSEDPKLFFSEKER